MRNRLTIPALAAVLALSAVPAAAQDATTISATSVRDGDSATVSGIADILPVTGPIDVGGTLTAFGVDSPQVLPNELTGAHIETLDDGLRFVWEVEDLPDTVPPEGVRYTWSFSAGGQQFQLQAKRSNVASITTLEDPVGHAVHASTMADWFQLRGACETAYRGTPTAGCYHLTFLEGAFDAAANTVSIDLPFGTTDSIGRVVADTFRPGVEIIPLETAGQSIAGSFQAVISNTTVSSFINGWTPVFTGPTVQLGVGTASAAPSIYTSSATLDADGSFTGTVTGFTGTRTTVYARACNGLKTACVAIKVP